ncbi:MAG: MFS transporter [Rhodovibrionaceae bacterium]
MQETQDQSRLVFAFAAAGHGLFHILTALFLTIVLVLEEAWQRPYDDLIALWTVGAMLLGLAAPFAGWLSDRWGAARMMVVYFLGIGAATVLCGFASGPLPLEAALALIGVFGAIYHPVGTAWLVRNVKAKGKAIGALGIFGGLGTAFAALIAGALNDLAGWRFAFIVPGAVSIAAGIGLWALLLSKKIVERTEDLRLDPEPSRTDMRRALAALIVTMSLTTVVYYAFTTLLPKWLENAIGSQIGDGLIGLGLVIMTIYLLGALSQLIGGHLSDRGLAKFAYVASYALKLAALVAAFAISGWAVFPIAVLIVFAFDFAAPIENVLIARYSPGHRRGLAYGIRNGIAIVCAPLGVQLVAWMFDPAGGFTDLFLVLAGIVAVIFLAALALPPDRPPEGMRESGTV